MNVTFLLRGMAAKEAALDWDSAVQTLEYNPKTGYFYRLTRNSEGEIIYRMRIAAAASAKSNQIILLNGRRFYAHRLAWRFYYGKWPAAKVYHRNKDYHDNRICNLMLITNEHPAVLAIYNYK